MRFFLLKVQEANARYDVKYRTDLVLTKPLQIRHYQLERMLLDGVPLSQPHEVDLANLEFGP